MKRELLKIGVLICNFTGISSYDWKFGYERYIKDTKDILVESAVYDNIASDLKEMFMRFNND